MLYKTDIWDSVFNNFKDPICIVDRNYNILRINKNLLTLIGSDEQRTLGKPCHEYLFKGLSHKHVKQIERVPSSKERETLYFTLNEKYYELTVDPVFDDKQQVFALVFIYNDVSNQVKIDEILKKTDNQTLFQTLITNFPGMIYRCNNDSDWTMQFISDGCFGLTGYDKDDLIENKKLSFNDLVLPEYREKLWTDYQKVLANHSVYVGEYQIRKANGDIIWVWEQGFGVYSDTGEVIAIEGIIADISIRKRSEELLQNKEQRFSSLFNNAAIPIWEEDFSKVKLFFDELKAKGVTNFRKYFNEHPDDVKHCVSLIQVIDVNDESIRFHKLLKKEQMDYNLQHYFMDESYDVLKEEIIALAEGSTLFEAEIPVSNFAGITSYLLMRLIVIPGKENDLSQVLISFIDVTEKNEALHQLKDCDENLSLLINNLPDFICYKDGEGRWLKANDIGLKLFGLEGVDYKGKKDSDLALFSSFYKDVFLGCEESDEIAWQAGKTTHVEEMIPNMFGPPLLYRITKIPTYDKEGKRKGLIVVARDITNKTIENGN